MHREETYFYKTKAECVKSTSLPCYAPCAGRGALPIPRGVGRHTCARARDKAPLRGPLLAGAGAGWAGRGAGRRRWTSSPSRPSSNHCSVLTEADNGQKACFESSSLISQNSHQVDQRILQDVISMKYVTGSTLIRIFDREYLCVMRCHD